MKPPSGFELYRSTWQASKGSESQLADLQLRRLNEVVRDARSGKVRHIWSEFKGN